MIELQMKIGSITMNYVVMQTSAPTDYDGFGTFTIQNGMPENSRLIGIRKEHYAWQVARNNSGNHATWEPEGIEQRDIEEVLFKAFIAGCST